MVHQIGAIDIIRLGGSSHLVSPLITGLNSPTYDSWDEPPSTVLKCQQNSVQTQKLATFFGGSQL